MTLAPSSPVTIQVAPAHTPPDAAPHAWSYVGTVDDFEIEYLDKDVEADLAGEADVRTTARR
ncbi:hypothetical protein ABT033_30950 [Streptomyces pharetrae]|uniref:hypothetical protein n=1 Tax=Streptomyces pharetrae TaxID=291370 RepID=UPI003358E014